VVINSHEEEDLAKFELEAKYESNFFGLNYQSGDDDPKEDEDLAKYGLEAKYESEFFYLITKVVMMIQRKMKI
jgi:hypothetical protein